jgi:hypothetical protein
MEFQMMDVVSSLPFYGTGFARQSQAASVKLHAGQELTGQDMTIPISKLHKLSGRVAAGQDGHLVNAAKVALVTRDEGKELASTVVSRDDGLFHFEFIPEGDYIVRVSEARDVVWEAPAPPAAGSSFPMMLFPAQDKERVVANYGGVDQTLLFSGDTLSLTVTVPPDTKAGTTAAATN